MKITDDINEMIKLGRGLLYGDNAKYPDDFVEKTLAHFGPFLEDKEAFLPMLYCAVYCQEVYGTSLIEYGGFHFDKKTHDERKEYITWSNRFPYYAYLNKSSDNHFLDNKYEAYTLLKPYYKREAMLLSDETDYEDFCSFARRNPSIFVKPNNLELAEGAHRLICKDEDKLRNVFDSLLEEAANISTEVIKRQVDHSLILEEEIIPSSYINELNPAEMSLLRVTTVYIKGKVHFFYPCLRLLVGNGIDKTGEDYSYVALIDPESGQVVTNGKNGFGDSDVNPITGQKICGMILPEWNELKDMLEKAAMMLPNTRYIGWDVTHTDKGWCIIEGNTNGEFFYQMCLDHGLKKEFEDLIGFHIPYDFWKTL